MLEVFVAAEGEAEVVMFSGGEPTIHKHILEFIDLAQDRPIRAVNLNTNGIRLASDSRFVAELGRRNRPGRPVNIYLQFDGFDERTHLEIRGRDLRQVRPPPPNWLGCCDLAAAWVSATSPPSLTGSRPR